MRLGQEMKVGIGSREEYMGKGGWRGVGIKKGEGGSPIGFIIYWR